MPQSFLEAFDAVVIKQVLKMIEDGEPGNLPEVLAMQLSLNAVPGWYKDEIIQRLFIRLKEEYKKQGTHQSREKIKQSIEIIRDNYAYALDRK
ncbi:MAG: hypothetical protein ABIQ40_14235 [Bacteroidia bacterium]